MSNQIFYREKEGRRIFLRNEAEDWNRVVRACHNDYVINITKFEKRRYGKVYIFVMIFMENFLDIYYKK